MLPQRISFVSPLQKLCTGTNISAITVICIFLACFSSFVGLVLLINLNYPFKYTNIASTICEMTMMEDNKTIINPIQYTIYHHSSLVISFLLILTNTSPWTSCSSLEWLWSLALMPIIIMVRPLWWFWGMPWSTCGDKLMEWSQH